MVEVATTETTTVTTTTDKKVIVTDQVYVPLKGTHVSRNGRLVQPPIGQPFRYTKDEVRDIRREERVSGEQYLRKPFNEADAAALLAADDDYDPDLEEYDGDLEGDPLAHVETSSPSGTAVAKTKAASKATKDAAQAVKGAAGAATAAKVADAKAAEEKAKADAEAAKGAAKHEDGDPL